MRRCSQVNADGTSSTPPCARDAIRHGTTSRSVLRAVYISAMTRSSAIRNTSHVFRGWCKALACVLLVTARAAAAAAPALEPSACHTVRLADGGWTDVTATTALLSHLLRDLGYEPQTNLLSVPVTFAVMKGRSIDV